MPIRGDKKDINLHMYWDGQFGQTRTLDGDLVRRAAALLADRKLVAAGRRAEKRLQGETWVAESHRLARDVVYSSTILAAIGSGESCVSATGGRSRIPAGPCACRGAVTAAHRFRAFRVLICLAISWHMLGSSTIPV